MGEYKEPEYIKQINKMLNMHNRITNFAMLNTNLDNYMNYQIQIIENNLNKWSTLQTRIDFVQPVLTPLYTVIKPYIYEQFSKVEEYSKIFGINEKFYLVSMYLGLWVPYVSDVLDYEFMIRIFDIVLHSKLVKKKNPKDGKLKVTLTENGKKKLNKLIFTYFDDKKIDEIYKVWANLEKNYKRKKIFKQCLDAYKRKEYALCTSTLIPIWERMIAEKSGHKGRLHANKNKEYVETLIEKNQLSKLLDDFYKNCVMYQCDSEEEVLPDVPGRHAGTHGWIIHNRKTSLNAILLTDFLLRLQPIEQSEYN